MHQKTRLYGTENSNTLFTCFYIIAICFRLMMWSPCIKKSTKGAIHNLLWPYARSTLADLAVIQRVL